MSHQINLNDFSALSVTKSGTYALIAGEWYRNDKGLISGPFPEPKRKAVK